MKCRSILFILLLPLSLWGQNSAGVVPEPLPVKLDGTLKTQLEWCHQDGLMRFTIPNARLGIRGDLSDFVSYRFQVDFCSEGTFNPLDFYAILKPVKGLSFQLGQQVVPFENSYIIAPGEMMFASKVFVGKYFTPGTRDIGLMMSYKYLIGHFPLEVQAGVFNGGKMNNAQWTGRPSYAFRLIYGSMDGFRASAKVYRYPNSLRDQLFWGADLHYAQKSFRVEAEVMNQRTIPAKQNLFGVYVQGTWYYYLQKEGLFQHINPALRWDAMGYDVKNSAFGAHRITLGIHFGLAKKSVKPVLRFDYERYFLKKDARGIYFGAFDLHTPDNKLLMEVMITF